VVASAKTVVNAQWHVRNYHDTSVPARVELLAQGGILIDLRTLYDDFSTQTH
jgi:hypothetical protein